MLLYISCCHTEKGKAVILCPFTWIVPSLSRGAVGTGFGYAKEFVPWSLWLSQRSQIPFATTVWTPTEAQIASLALHVGSYQLRQEKKSPKWIKIALKKWCHQSQWSLWVDIIVKGLFLSHSQLLPLLSRDSEKVLELQFPRLSGEKRGSETAGGCAVFVTCFNSPECIPSFFF